jgi:hypothetical protein
MLYIKHNDEGCGVICHYGVKGQKWGVVNEDDRSNKKRSGGGTRSTNNLRLGYNDLGIRSTTNAAQRTAADAQKAEQKRKAYNLRVHAKNVKNMAEQLLTKESKSRLLDSANGSEKKVIELVNIAIETEFIEGCDRYGYMPLDKAKEYVEDAKRKWPNNPLNFAGLLVLRAEDYANELEKQ